MTLSEFRTKFKDTLNRSDCTDAVALDLIDMGIKRVHRELRCRLMEQIDVTLTADANSRLTIPDDYLEMIALAPESGLKQLKKKQRDDFLRSEPDYLSDVFYTRRGGYWYLKPAQSEGAVFKLDYYAKTDWDISDIDTDHASLDELWDLLMFASLQAAGNHFDDDREAKWETQFIDRLTVLNDQADDQDLSEGINVVSSGTDTEF